MSALALGSPALAPITKRTLRNVWSPQLRNRRDIDVYLPPSYGAGRQRYPVVYMHDGQNLSDPRTAFAGTWELEAALARLARRGVEAIVVGVHNAREGRLREYSPFPDRRHSGGEGDSYLAFLVDTLKPRIDRSVHTDKRRDATVMFGSSMGGLISLYAYFRYPSVFGRAGAMSPSIWFGQGRILDYIAAAKSPCGRLYVDVGTFEGVSTLRDGRRLGRLLVRKGFVRRRGAGAVGPRGEVAKPSLRYVEDPGGRHNERDWALRLDAALEFLLA
jgi:predicted alpha/beta superfamily hydrolase